MLAANSTSVLPGSANRIEIATDEDSSTSAAAVREHLRAVEVRSQTSASMIRR